MSTAMATQHHKGTITKVAVVPPPTTSTTTTTTTNSDDMDIDWKDFEEISLESPKKRLVGNKRSGPGEEEEYQHDGEFNFNFNLNCDNNINNDTIDPEDIVVSHKDKRKKVAHHTTLDSLLTPDNLKVVEETKLKRSISIGKLKFSLGTTTKSSRSFIQPKGSSIFGIQQEQQQQQQQEQHNSTLSDDTIKDKKKKTKTERMTSFLKKRFGSDNNSSNGSAIGNNMAVSSSTTTTTTLTSLTHGGNVFGASFTSTSALGIGMDKDKDKLANGGGGPATSHTSLASRSAADGANQSIISVKVATPPRKDLPASTSSSSFSSTSQSVSSGHLASNSSLGEEDDDDEEGDDYDDDDDSGDSMQSECEELFNRNCSRGMQTSSSGSSVSSTIISSKAPTEDSWDVPSDAELDIIKTRSFSEIEFVLAALSQSQRTLNERTKDMYQPYDDMELEIFDKKCKIKRDVTVMLELLKQYNFAMDIVDIDGQSAEDDPSAGSTPGASGGVTPAAAGSNDDMERKTFLLAKKILFLKMEITKTPSTKRAYILFTIIDSITKYLRTDIIPSEVQAIPLEMTITMGSMASIQQQLSGTVYKKGALCKKKDRSIVSKFIQRWIVLTHSELLIYSSEKSDRLLHRKSLFNISKIAYTPKEDYPHCFTIHFVNADGASEQQAHVDDAHRGKYMVAGKTGSGNSSSSNSSSSSSNGSSKSKQSIILSCENNEEVVQWVLAIDGITRSNFKSSMDLITKEAMLSTFKTNHKGGVFRFGDEEWHYRDGRLTNQMWGDMLEYIWDGYKLVPAQHSQMSLGHGRWNGVWLTWYGERANEPYLKYLHQPLERNYIVDCYPLRNQFTWTWSRHFLVCASGGEWICEGDVPPALVMLVQMMKYYRIGR
ncbi:hypothetical protein SAMD00019534_039380 [Acytostelium subglobosum LB1]|uniref:hypothetical protein n=1 Tax=Acytostelium subglobosum LB1 TaxID=1410327 RepID=UPI0006450CEE|nr:hypothetical protein SAMD00019534_039380 [Acytostelium subglobosum LB1]GAM20763.1 hypothetical protein SAMD00019534_039380 [Acytostelium subglobosum LB1]|eukprot:XP_012755897.1 hypothetical protein SAMD00019534_039380 [Acytostelium subglobosum LB1]